MAWMPRLIGVHAIRLASPISHSSMVRYTACPDSTWPSSCPITHRSSSGSYRLIMPVVITRNGWSRPSAIAFTSGLCTTNTSGTSGRSRM